MRALVIKVICLKHGDEYMQSNYYGNEYGDMFDYTYVVYFIQVSCTDKLTV